MDGQTPTHLVPYVCVDILVNIRGGLDMDGQTPTHLVPYSNLLKCSHQSKA